MKLLYRDGTGLVMAYKRVEEHSLTWSAVKDGLMVLSGAVEALFAGLDWRRGPSCQACARGGGMTASGWLGSRFVRAWRRRM
ncbi:IS66 family insertion sequence element accessory protein TnpB [Mesorhizobium sp. M0674]|uniref:IS66 family insertion sequence element accessory protein TnpB n=1 Tax=unclassified Mesorhizobium TaxID=325217 RepID=UPI003338C03F